ncbi:hypothetical protein BH10PSE9_BH10PSE9_24890 [soil metagenome]
MKAPLAALMIAVAPGVVHAACAGDAIDHATKLLQLHAADGDDIAVTISDAVKTLPPIKAPAGKGKFDVLEVRGYIYKAEYRMRFLYAQIPDQCVLMGQEIIEMSDPY